jgi:hypothetical protein
MNGDKATSNDGEKYGLLFYSMYPVQYCTFHHGEGEITDEQGGLGRLQALFNGRPTQLSSLIHQGIR